MLKINLLPPYIFERRKVRQTALLFGLIVMLTFGVMVTLCFMRSRKEADLRAQFAIMDVRAKQVLALEDTIKAEEAKIPPIKDRMDYFHAVMAYNEKFPAVYEELVKYTYERVLYRSIQPSNSQLTIAAHAKSLGDCGRYLLNIYRARHLFSAVTISAVPGYPSDPAAGFDFTVTATLVSPIDPPAIPGTLGGGAASQTGSSTYSAPSSSTGPAQPVELPPPPTP